MSDRDKYHHCSNMREYLEREKREAERAKEPPRPPRPPPPRIPTRKITWAEAELLVPGIEAEWRGMCGRQGNCVPPAGKEWRVEEKDGRISVIEIDLEGKWDYAPTWHRHDDGFWTHPIPMLKMSKSIFFMDYRYDMHERSAPKDGYVGRLDQNATPPKIWYDGPLDDDEET